MISDDRPPRRALPLQSQLALALVLGAVVLSVVVASVAADRDRRVRVEAVHATALRTVLSLARRAAPLLERDDDLRLAVLAASAADLGDARVLLLDPTGRVRLDTGLVQGGRQLELATSDGPVQRPVDDQDGAFEALAPALGTTGLAGEVRLRYRLPEPSDVPFAWSLFGITLVASLSLVLLTWWLAHCWSARARALVTTLRSIARHGPPASPIAVLHGGVLGELEEGLHDLVERLAIDQSRAREGGLAMARQVVRGLEARGCALAGHGERTRRYAGILAERLDLEPHTRAAIETAAALLDLGNSGVRASALRKHGELTDVERASLRQAPVRGARLLSALPRAEDVADVVRHHREKYDGSGYPDGLRAERIPIGSRVVAIADAYDLLTTPGPRGGGLSWPLALERMREDRGEHFDPRLLDEFEAAIRERPVPAAPHSRPVVLHSPAGVVPYKLAEDRDDAAVEDVPTADSVEAALLDEDLELEVLADDGGEEGPR
jgi:hypothetical protein